MPDEPTDLEDEQFDEPTAKARESEDAAEEAAWDEPDTEAGESVAESEAVDAEADSFSSELLDLHGQVEQFLADQVSAASSAEAEAEDAFSGAGNIVGVGLGVAEDGAFGAEPGAPCIHLYVAEPCTQEEAHAALFDGVGVRAASSGDLPVNVVVTGVIDAQPHRFKLRPAPGGVSCGHLKVTAGTLGCLATGRRRPRNRRRLILSNNHVIANSNDARFGDSIVQPGTYDGGTSPRSRIAILERYVPINFRGGVNYVDCATAWAWPKKVRREQVYVRGGRPRYFRINRRPRTCRRGTLVGKSGRTTQITAGRVVDCNATIRVNYGRGRIALFKDQVTIRGLRGSFSRGGDSGSVIWTWDRRRNPVGLLFAGGRGLTFANKIQRVVRALDIRLAT